MNHYAATSEFFTSIASGNTYMPSMHYHASYELYYLQVGQRDYFIEDKLFSVTAGDFVLIPPGKLHRTGGEYGKRILVGFTAEYLQKFYTEDTCKYLLACFDGWKRTPSPAQQKRCIEYLQDLQDCKDKNRAGLLLGTLLLELSDCPADEIQGDSIGNILSFINKNYAQIKSIDEIASAFFISKFHLCRIFKNAMKITVVDYLNQIRIKNACQMLTFSDKSINQIAEDCGFHSASYFSSLFKNATGKSPSDYARDTKSALK